MAKVSVIIPTYNCARYICEAVDSVLAQTFTDLEVIVVDDGSTDDTKERLDAYRDCIRYIHQENQERSAARNTGIRNATGEYLAFLDADDLWLPHKLELQVPVFEQAPEVGLVYCWAYYIDASGQRIHRRGENVLRSFEAGGNVFETLLFDCVITAGGSSAVIRQDCIRQVGFFDEALTHVEDWDMWLRIAARYSVAVVPQALVCFRVSDPAMLLEKHARYDVPGGRIRVIEKARPLALKREGTRRIYRRALAENYRAAARTRLRLGDRRVFCFYMLQAVLHAPALLREPTTARLVLQFVHDTWLRGTWLMNAYRRFRRICVRRRGDVGDKVV